jgi:excisionase family DNA binding protein
MGERDEFLTVPEVVSILKLNPQTVRTWIDQQKLPAVRVGQRRVRIRQSDLDAFIAASSAPKAPEEPLTEPVDEDSVTAWATFGATMASACRGRTIRR